ncbi:fatty acid synthase-like [Rhipicephalus sanguineus]|uniref:fatty acid synthase-like n=1 Tax=Rhipicephalus sanguineus TaxID=34632 RepID=UPI0020C341E3|nr:fatty acid synthase-like [Rhipicephalus sanguineus]
MWLLAEEAGTSGVVGLANCLRYESGGSHIRCVFDAGSSGTNKVADFSAKNPEYKDVMDRDMFMNVYRSGQWGSYRYLVAKNYWCESPLPYGTMPTTKEATGTITCDVHYAAVNSRDVVFATGQLPPEALVE